MKDFKPDPHQMSEQPTHPTKDPKEVNQGQIHTENINAANTSAKEHMVDIGRGENTAGRQTKG